MASATYDAAFDPNARAARLRYVAWRIAVYAFLGVFALIYLLPLFVIVANSFRDSARDLAQRPDRVAAKPVAESLARDVVASLRRRNLRGHPAQLSTIRCS